MGSFNLLICYGLLDYSGFLVGLSQKIDNVHEFGGKELNVPKQIWQKDKSTNCKKTRPRERTKHVDVTKLSEKNTTEKK